MIAGLLGAVLVGLALGLMGSGGSILTVPVLTFLVGQDEKVAVAGSMAIVGLVCAVAGVPYARQGNVDVRSLVFFGLPGMAGSYAGAWASQFVVGAVQLAVFAGLMLVAAVLMFRPLDLTRAAGGPRSGVKIAIEGILVGAVTGFVGAGGGFLIVPALVLLGGLPMHRAVGTSLFIIALKSIPGFAKHYQILGELGLALDWSVVGAFTVVGIAGSFAGNAMGRRLPQDVLRKLFAAFLVILGVYIVARSVPRLVDPPAAAVEWTDGPAAPAGDPQTP